MYQKQKRSDKTRALISILLIGLALIISAFFSSYITEFTKTGIKLCFGTIIGAVFPFIILTDILISETDIESIPYLSKVFEKLFSINGYAVSAFIVGCVCGFPLGVKTALDLYKAKKISRDECERLIGFSNNTGPAFVVSGVGYGMRGSLSDGIILYISMLISAVIVGIILGIGKAPTGEVYRVDRREFDFVSSVKSAMQSTINVCAFVILFSVFAGFLGLVIKYEPIYLLLISFLEVGGATATLSASTALNATLSLSLSAFAISFSGISVHMQAKSFLYGTDISMKRYYFAKILQGSISAAVAVMLKAFI